MKLRSRLERAEFTECIKTEISSSTHVHGIIQQHISIGAQNSVVV